MQPTSQNCRTRASYAEAAVVMDIIPLARGDTVTIGVPSKGGGSIKLAIRALHQRTRRIRSVYLVKIV